MDFCLKGRMKKYSKDILAERPEMKKMPYSTPEGYFEDFKASAGGLLGGGSLAGRREPGGEAGAWQGGSGGYIWKPAGKFRNTSTRPFVFAAAASVAALFLGAYFISGFSGTDDFTQEDLLVFDEAYVNAEYYEYSEYQTRPDIAGHQYAESIAEAEYSEEDIIDYLIYSGISLEEIAETVK